MMRSKRHERMACAMWKKKRVDVVCNPNNESTPTRRRGCNGFFWGNHASRKTRTTTRGDWKTLLAHVQCPKVEKKENAKANGGVYIEACKWLCKCDGEREHELECSENPICYTRAI